MRRGAHTLHPQVMETDTQHKAILSDTLAPPCWYPDEHGDKCWLFEHCNASGDTCHPYRRYTEGYGGNPMQIWGQHIKRMLASRGDKLGRFDDES